jgi:sugar phosphate isomerase/epimerase
MKDIALQLYSLRDETAKDFKGAVKKVAEMGYTGVEFAGYGDLSKEEMKELLDSCGLKAVSSHVSMDELENNLDFHLDYLSYLGCSYITCPWTDMKTKEDAIDIAKRLDVIAEKCAMKGLNLCYHNHNQEFQTDEDGEYLIDIMLKNCGPLVQQQFDVYWIAFSGADPVEMIKRHFGRVPMIHIKELGYNGDEKFNAIVGQGVLDFPEILKVAKKNGAEHYIVEQESQSDDQFDACKQCIDYLKTINI